MRRPWDYVEPDTMRREEERIRFRQKLMDVPGGLAWLLHVAKLYDHRESLLGADHVGLPDALRIELFRREREAGR